MIQILSIGNSFSEDATTYLFRLAESAGIEARTVNLYIGGCTLGAHARNIEADAKAYRYDLNGTPTQRMVSIREALQECLWDIVTIQQASHKSGLPESYEPSGSAVIACVRAYAPGAQVYFHKTWAYPPYSAYPSFSTYHNSHEEMFRAISAASAEFALRYNLPVIPAGDVIEALYTHPLFSGEGGEPLWRDDLHLSLLYGRYAAAAIWFQTLFGRSIDAAPFVPEGAQADKIETIRQVCRRFLRNSL